MPRLAQDKDGGLARGQSQSRRAVRLDLSAATLIAGCETVRSEAPVVRLTCPPLITYDKEFQKRAGAKLSKLPPNSATQEVVTDYSKLRDASRNIKERHGSLKD
jgi:hypothetical protein